MAALALGALAGCVDTVANDEPEAVEAPARPMFAAAAVQASLPGPAQYTINTVTSLPTFTNPTIAYVSVSGDIQVFDNCLHPGTLVGTIPPAGGNQGLQTNNCYGMVQIWYSYVGTVPVGTACNGPVRTTPIKLHGTGQATRGSGYPGASPPACGFYPYTPCYYYSGGAQAITLTPIDMQLKLRPSRYVVTSGMSVTFTASGTPDSVYPYKLPFTVQSWQWTPDSGTASAPCSAGVTACTKSIAVSGTMKVTALVNGEVKSESVHVRVLCQVTNDSILNKYPLLDAMNSAWTSSYTPNRSERREWWWTVDCDPSGYCVSKTYLIPGATRCGVPYWPPEPPPGWTRKGQGHTHPFVPFDYPGWESISDSECPPESGVPTHPDSIRIVPPGPSEKDYIASQGAGGAGRLMCAIDPIAIYCWPSSVDPVTAWGQTQDYPRGAGSCKLALVPSSKPQLLATREDSRKGEV